MEYIGEYPFYHFMHDLLDFCGFFLYLWWGSQVDDALQLHPLSKLLHQEWVPVLVDGPLCGADTAQLKHVQGKDVSDRTQKTSSYLKKKSNTGPVKVTFDMFPADTGFEWVWTERTTAPSYSEITDLSL